MPSGHFALVRRRARTLRRTTATVGLSTTTSPPAAATAAIGAAASAAIGDAAIGTAASAAIGNVGHVPETTRARGCARPTPGRVPLGTVGRALTTASTRGRARPPLGWAPSRLGGAPTPGSGAARPLGERGGRSCSEPAPGGGIAHPLGGGTRSNNLAVPTAPAVVSPGRTLSRAPAQTPSWAASIAAHRGVSSRCGSGRRQAQEATTGLRPAAHCGGRPRGRGGAQGQPPQLGHHQARRPSPAPPLGSQSRARYLTRVRRTRPRRRKRGARGRPHTAVARAHRPRPLTQRGARGLRRRPRGRSRAWMACPGRRPKGGRRRRRSQKWRP